MARALQRYRKLFDTLRKHGPKPLYFLYGTEEYIKREFLGELLEKSLGQCNRAFNLDMFHGDDFDRDGFHDRMSSFPLFTERRVVIVRGFDKLSVSHQDFVLEHLGDSPGSLVFVAESGADKLDRARSKKLDALARERGVSFRFECLSEPETIERLRGRLERLGMQIEPDALDLLIESVGTHLIDLVNELDKVALTAGEGGTVDREMVAAVVGKYRTENVFSFLDNLGTADIDSLVSRLNRLIDGGEEPIFVLAMLMRRALQLLEVKAIVREGAGSPAPGALAGRMSGYVSPFQAGRLLEQSRKIDATRLWVYLENLRWADFKLKSSSLPPRSVMETSLVASSLGNSLATASARGQ